MLNTIKTIPATVTHNPVAVALQGAASAIYVANMNFLTVTRLESEKVYRAAAREALGMANRNVKALKAAVAGANARVGGVWRSVENVAEARVVPVLAKVGLGAPAQAGLDLIDKGVRVATQRVGELVRERKPAPRRAASRKPVTRKPGPATHAAKAAVTRRTRAAA